MADRRRAEIEEKKAKLTELRRARDERKALLAQGDKDPVGVGSFPFFLSSTADLPRTQPLTTSRKDVNDLVDSLLGSGGKSSSPYQAGSSRIPVSSTSTPLPYSGPGRSTPTASIPGTPGGRTSRLSNEGAGQEGRRPGTGVTGAVPSMGDRCVNPM